MASASSSGEGHGEDVFEIEDFTIVTIKEALSAEIEQLLRRWNLTGNDDNMYSFTKEAFAGCEWDSRSEQIAYGNNRLLFTHCWPKTLQKLEGGGRSSDACSVDLSEDFLTNSARLACAAELDFCPGSVICNQVTITLINALYC
ncbi:unnamed protein product [Gongylonema pulchrum]|uniref:ADP-ribosyl cyclase/cyclic ADP-ribose hydrolase n=1 Tax=Gongylonema pulchrum TaxID=637853 RepID=A0A183DCC2_9BILA|nr:unnamed protein product [Gongylonema pulchrum]